MRKALRTVCDELRRTHKTNKILEEEHRALAGQLADCEVKRSLQACQLSPQNTNVTGTSWSSPAQRVSTSDLPKPSPIVAAPKTSKSSDALHEKKANPAIPSSLKQGNRPSKAERRLTLRLSKSLLRKISDSSQVQDSDSGESGSEIFEANDPEEVLAMQQLLSKLGARFEVNASSETVAYRGSAKAFEEAGGYEMFWKTFHKNTYLPCKFELSMFEDVCKCFEEPETSPITRASSRRLAPGLAEDVAGPPPRRLTIFSQRWRRCEGRSHPS